MKSQVFKTYHKGEEKNTLELFLIEGIFMKDDHLGRRLQLQKGIKIPFFCALPLLIEKGNRLPFLLVKMSQEKSNPCML